MAARIPLVGRVTVSERRSQISSSARVACDIQVVWIERDQSSPIVARLRSEAQCQRASSRASVRDLLFVAALETEPHERVHSLPRRAGVAESESFFDGRQRPNGRSPPQPAQVLAPASCSTAVTVSDSRASSMLRTRRNRGACPRCDAAAHPVIREVCEPEHAVYYPELFLRPGRASSAYRRLPGSARGRGNMTALNPTMVTDAPSSYPAIGSSAISAWSAASSCGPGA